MSHAEGVYLIIALSGRALSQSARRGNARVAVIDVFNDVDTRAVSERSALLAADPDGSGLDVERLLASARSLCPPEHCVGIVCGSGFETSPRALDALAAVYPLLGNDAAVIERVKDPVRLGELLDGCGFPRPEISLVPPPVPCEWMAKRVGASGGGHVSRADDRSANCVGTYFQRCVAGTPHSVNFVADGKRALVLGFNQLWTRSVGTSAYCYGGAINRTTLSSDIMRDIMARLDALVERSGLIGLNGIDFVADGDDYSIIEINPRPCATLDLYDEDYPEGLFMLHVEACRGRLPEAARRARFARAHGVVYTEQALSLPARFSFPSWCRDRSSPGSRFAAGSPVCTVHATGRDATTALRELADRERTLGALLAVAAVHSDPHEAVA